MNVHQRTIAIIGAGVAGLTAARALRAAGYRVRVFDKGRRLGGRVATRETREGAVFDHGAQYVTARSPGFRAVLSGAVATGMAGIWETVEGRDRFVGMPQMPSLAMHLARAVEVRTGVEITAVRRSAKGWRIHAGDDEFEVDNVVMTVPAPQARRLLGDDPVGAPLDAVGMSPCLTLMAAFGPGAPAPFRNRADAGGDLAWIAHDGSKPGRGGADTWVAQASPAWSRTHLEAEKEEIAALMLPRLAEAIGRLPAEATLIRGHRWRYARATGPLGKPFLTDEAGSIYLGGDWCLGPRVEAAWESGMSIAETLIERSL